MNVGERVGDYEIVQILGAGGMGQVYKVRNVFSERIEAMKVLLPNLGGDAELAERFQREIKVQAALDHPNIARLNTAQLLGPQLIMVMEFVDGYSVEALLRQGPMPLRNALSCMVQVLDALAYAHAHGVTHRDIKPANIMVTPQGVAKLMDFGIARMEADRKLTQTGHAVGSLFYMSPEQIKGVTPDARSDIYSLGITMYEMVTGRRPFEGASDFSIMAAHLQQKPVAPMEVIPGVPSELSDIILMAIAKEPTDRFQSAQAFQGALKSLGGFVAPADAETLLRSAPPAPPGLPPTVVNNPAVFPPGAPPPFSQAPLPPTVVAQQLPPQMASPGAYAPPPYPGQTQPPAAKSSFRGLYMALGSLVTLLVLAGAVVQGPKLWNSWAKNQPQVSGVGQPGPTQPPGAQPTTASPNTPVQPGSGQPPQAPSGQPAPVQPAPVQPAPVQPAPVQPAPVQPAPTQPRPVPAKPRQDPPGQRPAPVVVQPPVVQPQPAPVQPPQQPPAQPPQQPAVQPQPAPAPVSTGPSPQQMNELRQQYNLLAVRVGSSKNGLRSIQEQMRRQGLDMRGDILEAESRMDYLMKEAMDSMRAGDPASAKSEMQMAERALEVVEKFLGR